MDAEATNLGLHYIYLQALNLKDQLFESLYENESL